MRYALIGMLVFSLGGTAFGHVTEFVSGPDCATNFTRYANCKSYDASSACIESVNPSVYDKNYANEKSFSYYCTMGISVREATGNSESVVLKHTYSLSQNLGQRTHYEYPHPVDMVIFGGFGILNMLAKGASNFNNDMLDSRINSAARAQVIGGRDSCYKELLAFVDMKACPNSQYVGSFRAYMAGKIAENNRDAESSWAAIKSDYDSLAKEAAVNASAYRSP